MRKIYIAKRIASNTFNDAFVEIAPEMSAVQLVEAYKSKQIKRETYIHNGHWIIRAVTDGLLEENKLPTDLTPQHVVEMVIEKMNDSDALVAVLNSSAYGAIAELGYTVGTGKHAVYVLPERGLEEEKLQDLWMSFHLAFRTSHLWKEEDIQAIDEFSIRGIHSLEEYKKYVLAIIPNFLK